MNTRCTRIASVTLASCLAALTTASAQQGVPTRPHEVTEVRSTHGIAWQTSFAWDEAQITVSGPPGDTSWTVAQGAPLQVTVDDLEVWALLTGNDHGGQYNFEVRFAPVVDPALRAELDRLRSDADGGDVPGILVRSLPVVSGTFRIENGTIVGAGPGASGDTEATTQDQVVLDDMIVDGSLCVGFDCVNGESFGFDTIRLKENNLRIRFDDTSSIQSYPRNDWQLIANDSTDGGGSYFSIEDSSAGRRVFTVEAGAPAHSLYCLLYTSDAADECVNV